MNHQMWNYLESFHSISNRSVRGFNHLLSRRLDSCRDFAKRAENARLLGSQVTHGNYSIEHSKVVICVFHCLVLSNPSVSDDNHCSILKSKISHVRISCMLQQARECNDRSPLSRCWFCRLVIKSHESITMWQMSQSNTH